MQCAWHRHARLSMHAETTTTTRARTLEASLCLRTPRVLLQRSAMSMAERDVATSARRRWERQLRSFLRHEELSVKMALARALHHSAQRVEEPREGVEGVTYDAPRRHKLPPPVTRPASLAEPRGDVVLVQRHTVEQLADGAPRLPAVPQMVDQPVAVLARFDLPIPEQVLEVPKISCLSRFSRTALRSPRTAEQLVEVPVPSVHEVTILAPFVDTAGRTWCWISTPDGRYTWCLAGTQHIQRTRPEGITASQGRYI